MTAKKVGTATITVETKLGAKASFKVTVQKKKVVLKSIKVNATKKTLKVKKKFTIVVTKNPLTAQDKVTFKSSNKKVATVSSKGVVTAKKKGKATITVKAGKKTKKVKITVTK
ncbi:MAG: Ig-like domain-containing protein [Lachnospiraceae bacterium]|nr:Ig-like domain-containing protein [Lachnospiraceae bacterium]